MELKLLTATSPRLPIIRAVRQFGKKLVRHGLPPPRIPPVAALSIGPRQHADLRAHGCGGRSHGLLARLCIAAASAGRIEAPVHRRLIAGLSQLASGTSWSFLRIAGLA